MQLKEIYLPLYQRLNAQLLCTQYYKLDLGMKVLEWQPQWMMTQRSRLSYDIDC